MIDRSVFLRTKFQWIFFPVVLIAAVAAWFVVDPGFRTSAAPPEASSKGSPDDFEQRVRTYLLENPEVLIEAMQRLQARQRAAEESAGESVLDAHAEDVFRDPASPVGGNPEGDVTLVEFFDYNCPYCRRVSPVVNEVGAADRKLRIVYKEFPILGPNSLFAAKAALAAHRQGRYVELHNALMEATGAANENSVLAAANRIGLDVDQLKRDMEAPEIQLSIDRNLALAQALRITGTPSFVIGKRILRGATDVKTLQDLVAEARTARR